MDLPLITEATNDFYRNVYADPKLGPIFRGINMIVLRRHVSYFIHQITMFDCPMTPRQIEYLAKTHAPVIANQGATQEHFDILVHYLVTAMQEAGAQDNHLHLVKAKLGPLRALFPVESSTSSGSASGSSIDGTVTLQEQHKGIAPAHKTTQQQPTFEERQPPQHQQGVRDEESNTPNPAAGGGGGGGGGGDGGGQLPSGNAQQSSPAGGADLLQQLKQLSLQQRIPKEPLEQQRSQPGEATGGMCTAAACCKGAGNEQQQQQPQQRAVGQIQQQQQPGTDKAAYNTTEPEVVQKDTCKVVHQTMYQPVKKKSWIQQVFSCVH